MPTGQPEFANGMKAGTVYDTWDLKTIPASNIAAMGLVGLCLESEIKDNSKEEEIEVGKCELE